MTLNFDLWPWPSKLLTQMALRRILEFRSFRLKVIVWTHTDIHNVTHVRLLHPHDDCYWMTGGLLLLAQTTSVLVTNISVGMYCYCCNPYCSTFQYYYTKKPSCRWGTARARCQLKSGKMLHKCSTDCTWKGLQPENDLQGHSRSLTLVPFDRPHVIFY